MPDYLPNPFLLSQQSTIATCNGPAGLTGIPLPSGQYFSGRWGGWYNMNDGVIRIAPASGLINPMSTGLVLNYYPEVSTQSSSRINNLSLCFDNSGSPVTAIQDNGDTHVGFDNTPQIRVAGSGGRFKTGWRGWNPELFNTVQINFPFATPNTLYPGFQTGLVGCYYSDENGTNLFARYSVNNFSVEYLMNSGLAGGFMGRKIESNPLVSTSPYNPYQKVLYSMNRDKNVITYVSKPTINFAFDDFERNPAQSFVTLLSSGYGRWMRGGSMLNGSGQLFSPDYYFYDTFESYQSGFRGPFESGITVINYSGTVLQRTTGFAYNIDSYFYDTFESYQSGFRGPFESGVAVLASLGTVLQRTTGFAYSLDYYFFNTFENNISGAITGITGSFTFNTGLLFPFGTGNIIASGV